MIAASLSVSTGLVRNRNTRRMVYAPMAASRLA
jgi:hypothetical protein